jgi:GAF domain-containing protein
MPRPRAESEGSQAPPATRDFTSIEKLDRILHDLAARAQQETGASSVAIGLVRDDAVICRATAGLAMMEVGAAINTRSGLTAMAIRRQMSQWCNDTLSDTRVDIDVCQHLGVRSIIVVPIRSRESVIGVFAIFSVNPDAFSLAELNVIKKLAHWATEAVEATWRNAAPQTIAPAVVGPGRSREKQLVSVDSERAHAAGIKNHVVRLQRAIVTKLSRLIGVLRSRSV